MKALIERETATRTLRHNSTANAGRFSQRANACFATFSVNLPYSTRCANSRNQTSAFEARAIEAAVIVRTATAAWRANFADRAQLLVYSFARFSSISTSKPPGSAGPDSNALQGERDIVLPRTAAKCGPCSWMAMSYLATSSSLMIRKARSVEGREKPA